MKRCIALMVIALGLWLFAFDGVSQAWVNSGKDLRITKDTTFTKAHSPIDPGGDIIVESGVTLTIEPGVTIYLSDWYARYKMDVYGTLRAIGTEQERIVFTTDPTGWQFFGITIWDEAHGAQSAGRNMLRYCDIIHANSALILWTSDVEVSHCYFDSEFGDLMRKGDSTGHTLSIEHNVMRKTVGIYTDDSVIIQWNKFSGLSLSTSENVVLHYNWFWRTRYGLGYTGTEPIDARYNYWDTTDENEIKESLRGNVENIEYSPWLTQWPPDDISVQTVTWGAIKTLFR